jgi:hypothetical protein
MGWKHLGVPHKHFCNINKKYIMMLDVHCIVMNLVCGARMLRATVPKKKMIQKWAWMRIQYHLPLLVNLLDHPVVLEFFLHVLDET